MREYIIEFLKDESGISSVEYALLLALVAGGIIAAAAVLSNSVSTEISGAASCIETHGGTC